MVAEPERVQHSNEGNSFEVRTKPPMNSNASTAESANKGKYSLQVPVGRVSALPDGNQIPHIYAESCKLARVHGKLHISCAQGQCMGQG